MVRLSHLDREETGEAGERSFSTSSGPVDRGRRLAVDVVTEAESGPSLVSDGGLSPAARSWLRNTPGATVEEAREYDQAYRVHQHVSRPGDLQPRGEPGDPANHDRSVEVNVARHAVRKYRELEERTGPD